MSDDTSVRDELDIQRVISDYAWGCDNADWALLRTLFTEDATLDYTTTGGPVGGRDEVVAWLEEGLSQLEWIHHVVSNFQIDLDGDRADVRAMFHCSVKLPDTPVMVTGGYYNEEFVRTADGWKLKSLFEDNRWMAGPDLPGALS